MNPKQMDEKIDEVSICPGILRDFFAAMAMQSLWREFGLRYPCGPIDSNDDIFKTLSMFSYRLADIMLEERKK